MAKPIVLPEWDETEVNSVEPDATHKAEGWLAPAGVPEKPPYQSFNFWQNSVWKWLNEINIKGILGYDTITDYIADLSYVVGSNGYLYQCKINNGPSSSVVNPVGDVTGTWFISFGNDNILINQDFSIWQKEETFTNPGNNVYTADGYYVEKDNGGGTAPSVNVKKNTTVHEDAFAQSCELEITNVGVSDAARRYHYRQRTEDYKKYRGKTTTLSIRIKASVAMSLPGYLQLSDGVGNSSVAISSIGTGWTTYQVPRTIDSAATILEGRFIVVGGVGVISTTGSIYIQWMKLELGPGFTGPPRPRSNGEELTLCQRRRQKSYATGIFPGAAAPLGYDIISISAVANADHGLTLRTKLFPMAGAPTVTIYDLLGNPGKVTMAAGDNIAGSVTDIGNVGFKVTATNGAASNLRTLKYHWFAEYDL